MKTFLNQLLTGVLLALIAVSGFMLWDHSEVVVGTDLELVGSELVDDDTGLIEPPALPGPVDPPISPEPDIDLPTPVDVEGLRAGLLSSLRTEMLRGQKAVADLGTVSEVHGTRLSNHAVTLKALQQKLTALELRKDSPSKSKRMLVDVKEQIAAQAQILDDLKKSHDNSHSILIQWITTGESRVINKDGKVVGKYKDESRILRGDGKRPVYCP